MAKRRKAPDDLKAAYDPLEDLMRTRAWLLDQINHWEGQAMIGDGMGGGNRTGNAERARIAAKLNLEDAYDRLADVNLKLMPYFHAKKVDHNLNGKLSGDLTINVAQFGNRAADNDSS